MPGPFTMSQQAQDDYYKDEVALAMDYAAAVNEEIKDLFAAGADIVQIDEPYMQARPEKARAIRRRRRSTARSTASQARPRVHICFGYAAFVHERPAGYSFLPELADIAGASRSRSRPRNPKLDCAVLEKLPSKTIMLGVIDLGDTTVETPETVADAHPPRPAPCAGGEHHHRARLRHEISAARRRFREDEGDGRGRRDRARAKSPGLLNTESVVVIAGLDPRLSGLILVTRRMALILLCSERLATFRDTKKDQRHAASE